MKVLVAYYSETGNTEKIAQAIFEEVSSEHEAQLKKIRDITAGSWSDNELVFLGAPCHDSDLAKPVKRVLATLPHSPRFKLAGFFTHATYTPEGSARARELFSKWAGRCSVTFERISKEKHVEFLGYFHCQGTPSPPIETFIKREIITTNEEWAEYIVEVRRHPSREDVQNAKLFAREVISNY